MSMVVVSSGRCFPQYKVRAATLYVLVIRVYVYRLYCVILMGVV